MITICIPAYKYIAMAHEAAASVLNQDVDVELVVLDDYYLVEHTTENLRAIESLKDFLHADKRVKCVSNEYLLPIQDNWNKAVSLGTGKYIKLMGADDRMLPGSIKMMESIIKSEPTVEFHGHLAILIDEKGELIRKQRPYGKGFVGQPITGAAALKGKLRQQVRFKEPACNFYLKSAWEKIGGYDTKFRFSADVHFNSKLMSTSKSMLWNEYLVELRRHQGSDGAQLPAALALSNLEGFVDELLLLLGSEVTAQDRAVGKGWVQYRIIELVAQRFRQHPTDSLNLLARNFYSFASNPAASYWMLRMASNRLIHGDIQQG